MKLENRLTDEEQDRLLREFKRTRDPEIRARLILHNQKLASWHARRVTGYVRWADDLEQAAVIGIMRAVDGFDPDKGFRFASYASCWIRSEIQEFFRRNSVVPLSKGDSQRVNSEFTAGNMSAHSERLNLIRNTWSIDMPVEFGGNRIQAEVSVDDDHGEDQASYKTILERLIPRLSRESQVVIEGKLKGKEISGIAKDIGRSPEHVRQKYHAAMAELKDLTEIMGVHNPFRE